MAILFSLPIVVVALSAAYFIHQLELVPPFLALLLGVMPNPAAAGLHFCAKEVARDDPVVMSEVFDALKRLWKQAAQLYALSLVTLLIIVINIVFYAALRLAISPILDIVWVYILFMWFMAQVYLYPMLFAMDSPSVFQAYKNSLVVALRKPLPTTILLFIWLVVLLISCSTGLVLILGLIVPAIMQQSLAYRVLPTMVPMSAILPQSEASNNHPVDSGNEDSSGRQSR